MTAPRSFPGPIPDGLADRRDDAHHRLRELACEAETRTGLPLVQALEAARRADAAFIRALNPGGQG